MLGTAGVGSSPSWCPFTGRDPCVNGFPSPAWAGLWEAWACGDLCLCAPYSLCSFDTRAALVCAILQATEAGPIDI